MKECKDCLKLKTAFDNAKYNPHEALRDTYILMQELYNRKKLTLYMSDYSFENWDEEIRLEQHLTYNLYLKCRKCKKIYYLGVCVRGTPIYRILDVKPSKMKFWYMCLRDNKKFYT